MNEKEILLKVADLFTKYGVKSMTMDDVSRHLGISKKTLYQYVSNKKELVKRCMEVHMSEEQGCIDDLNLPGNSNAIDELMAITKMVGSQMKEMHPSVIYDLKKYYPDAYHFLAKHRDEFIQNNVKNNIENGVKDGLYRDNINSEILTKLYLSMINVILDPENETLKDYSAVEIHQEMMRYHIRGIASGKGREYLKEKFRQDHV